MAILSTLQYIFVYFLVIAICGVPITTALMFNLAEIRPHNHNKDIVTDGAGTYISNGGIQLASPPSTGTSPEAVESQIRSGRATYAKLLHLWDIASGQLADFTTNFSFVMDSDGATEYGDGLSFFLARNSSLITASGAMGLPVVANASDTLMPPSAFSPFVAVEFDTYWNPNWDPVDGRDRPTGDHVGININSLVSVKAEKWWSNITYGKECVVKIRYDSASQNLSVTFTGFQKNTIVPNQFELHYTVDLRRSLPEWVLFGFGASSSGDHFQRNSVKSWFFNSTDLYVDQKRRRKDKKKKRLTGIMVVSLCITLIGLPLAFGFFFFLRNKKRPSDQIANEESTVRFESRSPRPFTFEELSQATNNFDEDRQLGVGGFGVVYKAVLSDRRNAAVKRVSNTSQQGLKEYKAEVMIVSRSSHRHLVQLYGWCHERRGEFLIVYEFMENRSLDIHLFNSEMPTLAWNVRYKIAQGLAKAVRYLHEECENCVLHRDIKSSNVLLDSNLDAKLSDFGLAKLVDHDKSPEISVVAGTKGYLAPECVLSGRVSRESDVYSFGVVALEIATGRKALDQRAEEDKKVLVEWVQNLYKMDKVLEAADPTLGDAYDELQMKGLLVLGLWCVHQDFHERPSMRDIVRALNNTQDPLSGLQERIPSLVRDSATPHRLTWILQTPTSSASIVPLEMETPLPMDPLIASNSSSGNTILVERMANANPPVFVEFQGLMNTENGLTGVAPSG